MGAENGIDVVCSGIGPNMMGSKMGADNDVSVDARLKWILMIVVK
jgi:hypothetical protein